jgi:hypothetical protein
VVNLKLDAAAAALWTVTEQAALTLVHKIAGAAANIPYLYCGV